MKISSLQYLVVFIMLMLNIGCQNSSVTSEQSVTAQNQANVSEACVPIKIAVFQDLTGSATWTRTPILIPEDFAGLYDILGLCGGEIGVGLIRENSNRGLLRLSIEKAPNRPAEPEKVTNPFIYAEIMAKHKTQLEQYESQYANWENETTGKISQFSAQLAELLAGKSDARRTDIWGAVQRADLFLSEQYPVLGNAKQFAVLVTDGLDNVKRKFNLQSSAQWLVVNGSASLGMLERLNPIRFESIGGAFRYIISTKEVNSLGTSN